MPVWMLAAQAAFLTGPYARGDALLVPPPPAPDAVPYRQFELAEFDTGVTASFGNPFDPRDIAVDLEVESPARSYRVPAYFDAPSANAPAGFRIRWTPREAGPHRLRFVVRTRAESRTGDPITIDIPSGTQAGFAVPSEQNPRYLRRENGLMPYPVGVNLPLHPPGKAVSPEALDQLARAGVNLVAATVQPSSSPFALERRGRREDGFGLGQYDLAAAQRLDRLFRDAAARRIDVWLNLDHARSLRHRDPDAAWDNSPYSSDHGGPLRIWSDYWTDDTMRLRSEARIRYLVARYGALPNLLGWELWNSVDRASDFDAETVTGWHQRTARFLREVDPYGHPVGTVAADPRGVRLLDALPELEIVSTILDERPDPTGTLADQLARKSNFGKPQWVAETGPIALNDPTGFLRRDPLWISIVAGAAGSARVTITDQELGPDSSGIGLRSLRAIAEFTRGIDFAAQEMRPTPINLTYADGKPRSRRRPLEIAGDPNAPNDPRRPIRVQVSKTGGVNGTPPAVLHGVGPRSPGLNPVTFRTAFGRDITFDLLVTEVGPEGAIPEIFVDGQPVRSARLTSAGPSVPRPSAPRAVSAVIPAGYHNLVIRNVGPAELTASYRFRDAIPTPRPPVQAWATHGARHILLWMRHEDMTWQHVAVRRRPVPASPPVALQLRGLASGRYAVTLHDPQTGVVRPAGTLRVPTVGVATFRPPPFTGTVAYRFDRTDP
ncbi:MAG: DUF5060 domain-containing protein [Fimbriimonadaceae bacterium]|nr:DUF5060 domain-containing protein [Fimbriimonadaceae bacterium]